MGGRSDDRKQLGKILLKQKLLTPEELEELLGRQKASPGSRLASTAQESGKVSEVDLLRALSEQQGVPGIDLAQIVVPLSNLELLPAQIARQHLILPILVKEEHLLLAMADPTDRRVIDEIEFVTGRRVFPYIALQSALRDVIDEAYRLADRGEEYLVGPRAPLQYLEQIGLGAQTTPDGGAPTVMEPVATFSSRPPMPDDDLGIAELTARRGGGVAGMDGLDAAFDSKVERMPSPPGRRDSARTVLVVDDEDDIRRLLRRVLTDKGYVVSEAARGLDALQAVRAVLPDVILLDAMLPEVHGFEICKRIRGSKRYGHIPIIMISAVYRGWRFAADPKQSYGVEAFLEKPFKIGDVLAAVERAIEGRAEANPVEDDAISREASESLARGIEAYKAGDLDGAIECLKEGIRIDPLSFKLHYQLGLLFGRREDIFDAIQELETSVDLQPKHFSALKNLAVLYQKAGFKYKATEMWERALASAPDDETRRGIKDHLMTLL